MKQKNVSHKKEKSSRILAVGPLNLTFTLHLLSDDLEKFNLSENSLNSIQDFKIFLSNNEYKNKVQLSSENKVLSTLITLNKTYKYKTFIEYFCFQPPNFSNDEQFLKTIFLSLLENNFIYLSSINLDELRVIAKNNKDEEENEKNKIKVESFKKMHFTQRYLKLNLKVKLNGEEFLNFEFGCTGNKEEEHELKENMDNNSKEVNKEENDEQVNNENEESKKNENENENEKKEEENNSKVSKNNTNSLDSIYNNNNQANLNYRSNFSNFLNDSDSNSSYITYIEGLKCNFQSFDYLFIDTEFYFEKENEDDYDVNSLLDLLYNISLLNPLMNKIVFYPSYIELLMKENSIIFKFIDLIRFSDTLIFEKEQFTNLYFNIIKEMESQFKFKKNTNNSNSPLLSLSPKGSSSSNFSLLNSAKKHSIEFSFLEIISISGNKIKKEGKDEKLKKKVTGIIIDNFKSSTIVSIHENELKSKEYEIDLFPKKSVAFLKQYEEYVLKAQLNKTLLYSCMLGAFFSKFIYEKTIDTCSFSGIELIKRVFDVIKLSFDLPNNTDFYSVVLSKDILKQVNSSISNKNLENKFTLDCINKSRSSLKPYDPLLDNNLSGYFTSNVIRNHLKKIGVIGEEGVIKSEYSKDRNMSSLLPIIENEKLVSSPNKQTYNAYNLKSDGGYNSQLKFESAIKENLDRYGGGVLFSQSLQINKNKKKIDSTQKKLLNVISFYSSLNSNKKAQIPYEKDYLKKLYKSSKTSK